VNGAKAGIIMETEPKVGDIYNQEFAKGVAEDKGTVLSLDEKVCVPYGCFSNVLKTKDFSPLEPDIVENKYYAQNTGDIKEQTVKGESEVITLVQINGTGNNNNNTNLSLANQTTPTE
jgi:hypothetical protein